jgi:hypothetical protein
MLWLKETGCLWDCIVVIWHNNLVVYRWGRMPASDRAQPPGFLNTRAYTVWSDAIHSYAKHVPRTDRLQKATYLGTKFANWKSFLCVPGCCQIPFLWYRPKMTAHVTADNRAAYAGRRQQQQGKDIEISKKQLYARKAQTSIGGLCYAVEL